MSLTDRLLYKLFKAELTYSQAGEDRILKHLFNSVNKNIISYLDIGTNHPMMHNNTYLFYKEGGHGVCVEPNPRLARIIGKLRPRDKCLNIGIGSNDNEVANFYSMSSDTLSTFSTEDAEKLDAEGKYKIVETLKISLKNINTIIEENFDKPVDLVSIDVEGWNEEIIDSFDFTLNRPYCFCVETINFSEVKKEAKLNSIFRVFEKNGYSVYGETQLNTIFLNDDI
jgi:FkbM family methyltransferase